MTFFYTLKHVEESDLDVLENNPNVFWDQYSAIGESAFSECSIQHIKVPRNISFLGTKAFFNCKQLETIELCDCIDFIGINAFEGCSKLRHFVIPEKLKSISFEMFKNCSSLQSVDFSENCVCKSIDKHAFEGCLKLNSINLPTSITSIPESCFLGCLSLEQIQLPKKLQVIYKNAFRSCRSLSQIQIPSNVSIIEAHAFQDCSSLKQIDLPHGIDVIGPSAFQDCTNLDYVFIPSSVITMGNNAFKNTSISFAQTTKSGDLILSKNPIKHQGITNVFDLRQCIEVYENFDFDMFYFFEEDGNAPFIKDCIKVADFAHKNNICLNLDFVCRLKDCGKIDEFCNSNFKYFRQLKSVFDKFLEGSNNREKDFSTLLTLSFDIGCFSNNQRLSQRSAEWLKERMMKNDFSLGDLKDHFSKWEPVGANEEFSNFLFSKDQTSGVPVFEQIKNRPNAPDFMWNVFSEFRDQSSELKKGGRFRDEKGRLMFAVVHRSVNDAGHDNAKRRNCIPTVNLFEKYFKNIVLGDAQTNEDKLIVDELFKWADMDQSDFVEAKKIMNEFHESQIPNNIVGKHLQNFTHEILKFNKETNNLFTNALQSAQLVVKRLSKVAEKFSYDWLERNDPMNFCLGLYCDCCAHLNGVGYGIMHANFINPNVQNLVIKNSKGIPVAKATAYVNRSKGYVVFNTIQVSESIEEKQKEKIFDQFLLGVEAFAKAYNQKHPFRPIKIMTVGIHLNSLKNQIINSQTKVQKQKGLDFSAYGKFAQDYDSDWNKDDQYCVWRSGEKKEER